MPRRPDAVDPSASPWHLLGSELRYRRDEVQGMSQREAAARAFCDDGDLSKWERGLARVQPDVIQRLDDLYNAKGRLVALYNFASELCQFRRGTLETSNPSGSGEDGDMHRRAAMQLFAALGAGAAIPPGALEDVLSGVERALDARVDLDEWERAVHEYAHLHVRRPVGALVRDLTSDVIAVGRLLDRGRSPSSQAGLFRVSAGLSGLLGTELSDAGDLRASRVAWRTARRAADASGDRDLSVWVRAKEASDGVWGERPVTVVARLADEAIGMAQGAPSYGLFRAHTVRARLAAEQGDHTGARAAIRDFTWTLESLPEGARSPDAACGLVESGLGGGFLSWHQAHIRTVIGDDSAGPTAERALAAYPAEIPGPRVLLQLMHAVRLVREREVREGVEHALAIIQTDHVSAAQRHFVKQLLNAMPRPDRTMESVRELRALVAAPAGA